MSAWLPWERSKDSRQRPLPGPPASATAQKATARGDRPVESSSRKRPRLGAGSRVGRSSAGRGVALPVPARRGGRTRVLASRPRAPPGLASAAAPEAGGPGLCAAQPSAAGGGQSARPRAPRASATPGARGEAQRGPVPALPVPVGSAPSPAPRTGRRGVAPESATRGARTALIRAAPRQADARRSMVGSERDEPSVLHRPQR